MTLLNKLIRIVTKPFAGLSRDVWSLSLIYLVNRCGEMVIPFMSVYLTDQLAFSKTQTGMVLFFFGLGALCGSNIGGYLTDLIGNFKVMAISLLGTGIAFSCLVFFQTYYLLCGWIFISAIFSSMFSPGAFGAITLWGDPEKKTRGYTLLRMAINLGVAIGPAIGGLLASRIGYNWLFIMDGMTALMALGVLFLVLGHRNYKYEKQTKVDKTEKSPYRDTVLILFLFFNLLNMIAFFQILFAVPVYFKEVIMMDEAMIGLFFTFNGLLVFATEMPIVYIIEERNKFFRPMIMGALLIGLAYVCLYIFPDPVVAILGYSLLVGIGEVLNFPLIPSLSMRRAGELNQGKYMGMVSMMFAMAFMFAPLCGLPVVEIVGYDNYWLILASMSVLSGICLSLLKPSFKQAT